VSEQVKDSGSGTVKVRLVDVAHARSGDKGDTANVGLIALEPRWYELLERHVTRDRVAEHFRGVITGDVVRFELPNLLALNFLHALAQDGRAGQGLLDRAAADGARRAGRRRGAPRPLRAGPLRATGWTG
jgi:hypothetical protein